MAGGTDVLFVVTDGQPAALADTQELLKAIIQCKPWFDKMHLELEVKRVMRVQLSIPALVAAFKAAGVGGFPALKTNSGRVVLGVAPIKQYYLRLITDYKAAVSAGKSSEVIPRRGPQQSRGLEPDDIYRRYVEDDVGPDAVGNDQDGMTDEGNMMAKYQEAIKIRADLLERQQRRSGSRKPAVGGKAAAAPKQAEVASPAPESISTAVDADSVKRAFAADGTEDAREDHMLRTFWENQTESI